MPANQQIRLASRPTGMPTEANFRLTEEDVTAIKAGQVLVRVIYLSVDPYMRGRMNDGASYVEPFAVDAVLRGSAVGEVVESRNGNFAKGDTVVGDFGWQEFAVADGKGLRKIDATGAPISTALGVLGMTGMTAYFGLLEVAGAKKGDRVLVSGAAGAVGSVVGQIAKLKGCRVVGSAGSDEKIRYLTDTLGFDAAFNYKTEDVPTKLREHSPDGYDVYFDNVGGEFTDAVIPQLRTHARVAVCGQISQYNVEDPPPGPRWLFHLIVKRAKVQGFLISDFANRFPEALRDLSAWYDEGNLKFAENIVPGGIEAAPKAFLGLFDGDNIGKQLVQISPE